MVFVYETNMKCLYHSIVINVLMNKIFFFSGKTIQHSQSKNMNSQPESDPASGDQASSREFNENAKSRLLMPPGPPPCKIYSLYFYLTQIEFFENIICF